MPRKARNAENEAQSPQGSEIGGNFSLRPRCRGLAGWQPGGAKEATATMAMAEIPMRPCHVPKRRRLRTMMTITTQSSIYFAHDGVPISS